MRSKNGTPKRKSQSQEEVKPNQQLETTPSKKAKPDSSKATGTPKSSRKLVDPYRRDYGDDYEDDSIWTESWTGTYYPKALCEKPGDKPVSYTHEADPDQEYEYEHIMDICLKKSGETYVLLKWKGYALDIGTKKCTHPHASPKDRGHWQSAVLTFGEDYKKHAVWRAFFENPPKWFADQRTEGHAESQSQ